MIASLSLESSPLATLDSRIEKKTAELDNKMGS